MWRLKQGGTRNGRGEKEKEGGDTGGGGLWKRRALIVSF